MNVSEIERLSGDGRRREEMSWNGGIGPSRRRRRREVERQAVTI